MFTRALGEDLRRAADLGALAQAWDAAWSEAQRAWPDVELSQDQLAPWVVERLPEGKDPSSGLAALRVSDLYLTCACIVGGRGALRAFERTYGSALAAAARRGGSTQPEEIVQVLRVRLLVGASPRLRDYAGTGSLGRWLKIACTRLAIDAGRSDRRRPTTSADDDGIANTIAGDDPELKALKVQYRQVFRQAFAEAMTNLTPRARTMLRLHLIHGLTIDQIAPMHQVHRATAARWLAKARGEVLEGSRERLGQLLETNDRDVESIMHLIASRLDVSIIRHLDAGEK